MAGLVSYASSDDEDMSSQPAGSPEVTAKHVPEPESTSLLAENAEPGQDGGVVVQQNGRADAKHIQTAPATLPSSTAAVQTSSPQPAIGPVPLGPSFPPPEALVQELSSREFSSAPSSPYTSTRALIHELTLPTIPNLDIPPSPPGSPSPATNKKFQQFLDLKRKGTHFNTKLESSSALRNPSLTDKLLAFAELAGTAQYETTLPADLYSPAVFPQWAYWERLKKTREALAKGRKVDFVSASATASLDTGSGASASFSNDKRTSGWG